MTAASGDASIRNTDEGGGEGAKRRVRDDRRSHVGDCERALRGVRAMWCSEVEHRSDQM